MSRKKSLWDNFMEMKNWWLTPILILLLIIGAVILLTQGFELAPFIYSRF
jgi:preprotein translocase subunit SecF